MCLFSFNVLRQIIVTVDMHCPLLRIMRIILGLLTMVLILEDMMIIPLHIMVVDLTLHKIEKSSKRETYPHHMQGLWVIYKNSSYSCHVQYLCFCCWHLNTVSIWQWRAEKYDKCVGCQIMRNYILLVKKWR